MRYLWFSLSAIILTGFLYVLDSRSVLPAPLGKLLSPQEGIWQNADRTDMNFAQELKMSGLKGKVSVFLDDRLVPHVRAEQETDAYFVQGYLHARFRLWQMEFQALATALENEDLGYYCRAHARLARRPLFMAEFMLLLDRSELLRRRVFRAFSHRPDLFARILATHVGKMNIPNFAATAATLGWEIVTA